jgi:hypothetical protein
MAAPFRVKALFEYSSPHEDDLNFHVGQVITVTDEEDPDWYGGEYHDDDGSKHEGIFPRNFVEKFEPTAPPRPTRTRTKKESEAPQQPAAVAEVAAPPPPPPAQEEDKPPAPVQSIPGDEPEVEEADAPLHKNPVAEKPAPIASPPQTTKPVFESAPTAPTASVAPPQPAAAASSQPPPKPKPGPPPVSEKPTSNSFRDRIAAFNKPAAPPVAPFKPSGLGSGSGSGFIKKPFVAPPPSRHAYVPPAPRDVAPAKVYRREEDPEIKDREAETLEQAERAGLVPSENAQEGEDEDQPKPTSLKERIALLQKQQMEQAQRHAEAAGKKEKPKRPVKKRTESSAEGATEYDEATAAAIAPTPLERRPTEDTASARTSMDEPQLTKVQSLPRRKSSKGPAADLVHDGNEADMSGAGDTTEGHDDTTEREDNNQELKRRLSRGPTVPIPGVAPAAPPTAVPAAPVPAPAGRRDDDERDDAELNAEQDEEEEEEEDEEEDPEVRRKEELRARMAKMSGGMGFHGMFGAPMPPMGGAPPKKKKSKPEPTPADEDETDTTSRAAPPVPTMMALPGMGGPRQSSDLQRDDDNQEHAARSPPSLPSRPIDENMDEEEEEQEAHATRAAPPPVPNVPPREQPGSPPPIPGGRPAPPPVPAESRPVPPPPTDLKSATEGSESDDELSPGARDRLAETSHNPALRSPPLPPHPVQVPEEASSQFSPTSPRQSEFSPTSPTSTTAKRNSRLPPPIPGSAPAPPPAQNRPPPPPPPGPLSRQSTADFQPSKPTPAGEDEDEEVTEYEGDYDTDIASSVPHKDALKTHARDSSLEDNTVQSPKSDAPPPNLPPPIPTAAAPRAVPPPVPGHPPPENKRMSMDTPRAMPPPIPTQPPPDAKRRSVDSPRAPPPPPPPAKELEPSQEEEDSYASFNYSSPRQTTGPSSTFTRGTPRIEEESFFSDTHQTQSPPNRGPPTTPGARAAPRQSLDVQRGSRRSMDIHRPSMEQGFIANDIDLAVQSGWWKQANQVPPVLQGRKDIFFECEESTTTNQGSKTVITREIFVLYQDYSQTVLTVHYDPYDPSDVELAQRHEPPPRPLRQDQMEEYYERFGRAIAEAVVTKKDGIVADGTPQGLVHELLRPLKDALVPVGTRSYGALVYANMANASTQQNDVIRAGDIISIRNARFQGKHGPMHAKYSVEVGKPDHVAIVAEWDGTKKKVRAWEQGRESKKVKLESFKLDDLRSGEVKIWRVMPRSWVGWNAQS